MRSSSRLLLRWSLPIVLALCLFGSAQATSLSDFYAYQTFALGGGKPIPKSVSDKPFVSLRYAMTLDVNRHLISPAFSILAETGGGLFDFSGHATNFDLGILYGRRLVGSHGYLYAGAGLAYVHAVRERIVHYDNSPYYGYDSRTEQTYRILGVPWNLSAAWMPDESFGLLFQLFGDINRSQSYHGWGVGLHLGG